MPTFCAKEKGLPSHGKQVLLRTRLPCKLHGMPTSSVLRTEGTKEVQRVVSLLRRVSPSLPCEAPFSKKVTYFLSPPKETLQKQQQRLPAKQGRYVGSTYRQRRYGSREVLFFPTLLCRVGKEVPSFGRNRISLCQGRSRQEKKRIIKKKFIEKKSIVIVPPNPALQGREATNYRFRTLIYVKSGCSAVW